jgi:alkylated DNA repair protein (DNA oxidative demethylase)
MNAQTMTLDLFDGSNRATSEPERLGPGAVLLHGFASVRAPELLAALDRVVARAPFRHMVTPGGFRMSVAMTKCGRLGWVTDCTGYRYDTVDPLSGRNWPQMPEAFLRLATDAAAQAGFEGFVPDACLVNRYVPGARLSLHQDRDESDLGQPIVSVSLGVPALFLFGGLTRSGKTTRVPLAHGDVVVWGGPDRLRYHGVTPVQVGQHPLLQQCRINLTFRKAG